MCVCGGGEVVEEWSEWRSGWKNRDSKNEIEGMRRGTQRERGLVGERDIDRRTAGQVERGRNRKAGHHRLAEIISH